MGDLHEADEALTLQRDLLEETLAECEQMLATADVAAAEIRHAANQQARERFEGVVRSLTSSVERLHDEGAAALEAARREAEQLLTQARDDAAQITAEAAARATDLQAELLAELEAETDDRLSQVEVQIAARLSEIDRVVASADVSQLAEQAAEDRDRDEAAVRQRLADAERAGATLVEEARAMAANLIGEAERESAERLAEAETHYTERLAEADTAGDQRLLDAEIHYTERLAEADTAVDQRLLDAETHYTERLAEADTAVDQRLLDAETHYTERLAEADTIVNQRLLDAETRYTERLAEADTIVNQRLLDAYHEARAIVESAEAEVAAMRTAGASGTALAPLDRPEPVDGEDDGPPAPSAIPTPRRRARWARGLRVMVLVTAVLLAFELIRTFVAAPYTVASTSMEPGLDDGVRVVVNKLAYRFGDPAQGDVVAFDGDDVSRDAAGETLVKRVIGVPGDVVAASEGRVLVNDEPLDEPWLDAAQTRVFGPFLVPEGTIFVLGDNRELSVDSRTFGVVPIDAVVGRVDFVFWPPGQAGSV